MLPILNPNKCTENPLLSRLCPMVGDALPILKSLYPMDRLPGPWNPPEECICALLLLLLLLWVLLLLDPCCWCPPPPMGPRIIEYLELDETSSFAAGNCGLLLNLLICWSPRTLSSFESLVKPRYWKKITLYKPYRRGSKGEIVAKSSKTKIKKSRRRSRA